MYISPKPAAYDSIRINSPISIIKSDGVVMDFGDFSRRRLGDVRNPPDWPPFRVPR
jgi:hypothetical protein